MMYQAREALGILPAQFKGSVSACGGRKHERKNLTRGIQGVFFLFCFVFFFISPEVLMEPNLFFLKFSNMVSCSFYLPHLESVDY